MDKEFYTPEELVALPYGTKVEVVESYGQFNVGDIIYRSKPSNPDLDNNRSCYFTKNLQEDLYKAEGSSDGDWMNFEEVAKVDTTTYLSAGVNGDRLRASIAQVESGEGVDLGVYRPELDTRKVGKVRVELVDDGFPLALREIAKVMTWAQTAKGYKDHDWQNLPEAEVALAAAASRHRTDHIKQRVVDGEDINDCVDSESKLLHKAHEAFGVLAQLELMLRGKFD